MNQTICEALAQAGTLVAMIIIQQGREILPVACPQNH